MTLLPERQLWGAIASCNGMGPRSLEYLKNAGLTAKDVWKSPATDLKEAGCGEKLIDRFVRWRTTFDLEKFAQLLETQAIQILFPNDEAYPPLLATINARPEILFLRGTPPPPRLSVACIGTRRPSEYGKRCVEKLIPPLAASGIPIISGLALGTDALAHAATLKEKGYTAGVLGSGVDNASITPHSNLRLAREILEQGGCLLSELPPGAIALPEHFPVRNRIIAGLSQATVVIEASLDSGTLITARLALEEGREVLAVPGSIWSDVSNGTHQLLRSGARLCGSVGDILEALHLDRVESCAAAQESLPITPDERSLLEQLTRPQSADELARICGWPIGRISQALSMLELKQLVLHLDRQTWVRA